MLAKVAASDEACRRFILPSLEEHLISGDKLRDPYPDKEVVLFSDILETFQTGISAQQWHEPRSGLVKPHGSESQVMVTADNTTSYAPHVSFSTLRRSLSDTQLSHNASSSIALPGTLAEKFALKVSHRLGEHRRAVSDTQRLWLLPNTLPTPLDKQASSPSLTKLTAADLATYDSVGEFAIAK
jgi:hypothetical protein